MTSQFFKTAEPRLRLALCSAFGRVYALVAAAAALLIALPILVMRDQLSIRPSVGTVSSVLLRPDGSSSSAQLRLSVPDSWSTFQDWAVIKEAGTGVAFGSVSNIYTDRCQWGGALLDPRVGPSVDDLAIAVAESWGSDATAPIDVMLDGFAGKQMVLTVPTDVDFADCFLGRFQMGGQR